jgi:hypothetical protein
MRSMLLIKTALLLLLGGMAATAVQAASLAPDAALVSNGASQGLLSRFSSLALARPRVALDAPSNDLGMPLAVANDYFESPHFAGFDYLVNSGRRVGPVPFDGLITALASSHFKVALQDQGTGLAGQSKSHSFVSQPSAVPLPAAVWLFASALLGFVTVANRRKV